MDRRLAGLAGTGTQAVEYPKRLSGTGDSRRNRFCDLSVLRWKAFAELWAPGGVVEEIQRKSAASTAGPFCKMEVNKCNVNHPVAIFAVSEEFHRSIRLVRKESIGTPVWNAPDWLTRRAGIASYSAA